MLLFPPRLRALAFVLTEERERQVPDWSPSSGHQRVRGAGEGDWSHTGLVPVLQPPKGSGCPRQRQRLELSQVPEQGLCEAQVPAGALGGERCERSSRAPSTATLPAPPKEQLSLPAPPAPAALPGSAAGHKALHGTQSQLGGAQADPQSQLLVPQLAPAPGTAPGPT